MTNKAKRHIVPASSSISTNRLNVIIAASGIGKGMKAHGTKSMLKIYQGMPLLQIQLLNIPNIYKQTDIYITTGFQSKRIRKFFRGTFPVKLIYNPLFEMTHAVYSIGLALECCTPGDLLIIHGDILFNKSAIRNLLPPETIQSCKRQSTLLIDNNNGIKDTKPGTVIQNDIVTNIAYSLEHKWGQIAFLTGKEAAMFETIAFDRETSSQWYTHEALNQIISQGGTFMASCTSSSKILEIDNMDDLKRSTEI
jgi:choline kinase